MTTQPTDTRAIKKLLRDHVDPAIVAAANAERICMELDAEACRLAGGTRTLIYYEHNFKHGTCHELPRDKTYDSTAWRKWREKHPDQWYWREREVDAEGYPTTPRWGPWYWPDGHLRKQRRIKGTSNMTEFVKVVPRGGLRSESVARAERDAK